MGDIFENLLLFGFYKSLLLQNKTFDPALCYGKMINPPLMKIEETGSDGRLAGTASADEGRDLGSSITS